MRTADPTERPGLALSLAAGVTGLSVCAVAALIGCFALPVILGDQGGLLLSSRWRPDTGDFGILPMIAGSVLLSFSALALGWPLSLGLACAIRRTGDGPGTRLSRALDVLLRGMTAVPTVVYGFASLFLLTPLVREAAGHGSGLCWLSAALVLALLITPTMALIMETALRMADPGPTAATLGLSRAQALACLAAPAARKGLISAAVLGFGRAAGDTLIPLMLSGNAPQTPGSLLDSLRTLTAHMGLVTSAEVGGPAYASLFVSGALLLLTGACVCLALRRLSQGEPGAAAPVPPAWWLRLGPGLIRILAATASVLVPGAMLALGTFLALRGVPALGLSLFFGDAPPLAAILGEAPVWDGIWPACVGTFSLVGLTMLLALGPGVGCGIYLAEYAGPAMRGRLGLAADILAGIPSIVMGIFGFTLILFLRRLFLPEAGTGLLLSGVCLALLVLPALVTATRSALEGLDPSLRLAGAALGLTRAQALRHILLPRAGRGVLGGVMLAMGRAAEDTAVILLTGVVANAGLPAGLGAKFEALPFMIYYTAAQYQGPEELERGFGAAVVLLLLSGTLLAAAARLHARRKRIWERGGDIPAGGHP